MLAVAKGYRDRHLPADVLVVDWFYYTKMGQMDFVPESWPDPAAMNQAASRHGLPDHDQRVAALRKEFALLRFHLIRKAGSCTLADGTPTEWPAL